MKNHYGIQLWDRSFTLTIQAPRTNGGGCRNGPIQCQTKGLCCLVVWLYFYFSFIFIFTLSSEKYIGNVTPRKKLPLNK